MLKATYGAGYRAGRSERETKPYATGTHALVEATNPFGGWHFIKAILWDEGYHAGTVEKLSGFSAVPFIHRINPVTALLFTSLFIIFKVL